MAQRSRFFDSEAGDRVYSADAWAEVFSGGIVGEGVVANPDTGLLGTNLEVTEANPADMSVLVHLGVSWVAGRFLEVYSAAENLTLAAADGSNDRIDRIVVRLDYTARTVKLAVLTGTAATTPVAPDLEDSASRKELGLATVRVNAGVTSVTDADITDTRSDPAVCGIVEGGGHLHPHDHDASYVTRVGGDIRGYREPSNTLPGSGTVTIDFSKHNLWEIVPSGDVTVQWAGKPPSGEGAAATLIVHNDLYTITWPSGTEHPEGTPPGRSGKTYLSIMVEPAGTVVVGQAWKEVS